MIAPHLKKNHQLLQPYRLFVRRIPLRSIADPGSGWALTPKVVTTDYTLRPQITPLDTKIKH